MIHSKNIFLLCKSNQKYFDTIPNHIKDQTNIFNSQYEIQSIDPTACQTTDQTRPEIKRVTYLDSLFNSIIKLAILKKESDLS